MLSFLRGRPFRNTLFILVPLIVVAGGAPSVYSNELLLFNFVVFLVLTQGINICYGFTGYLPFGYVGFFGAGAYGFAIGVLHLHLGPIPALGIGALASIAFAIVLVPTLKLSGAYFAIANLAAGFAIGIIVANPALVPLTQGPYGISLANIFNPTVSYGIAVVFLALTTGCVIYLRYSRFGLALQAMRDDQISAAMAGINVPRARTIAWLLSALAAGLIGACFAWYVSVFYPDNVFSVNFSIFSIVFALFGGVGTVLGPIFGVIVLYGLYNYIGITAPQYFELLYGLLIMAVVLFLPNGLASLLKRLGINVV